MPPRKPRNASQAANRPVTRSMAKKSSGASQLEDEADLARRTAQLVVHEDGAEQIPGQSSATSASQIPPRRKSPTRAAVPQNITPMKHRQQRYKDAIKAASRGTGKSGGQDTNSAYLYSGTAGHADSYHHSQKETDDLALAHAKYIVDRRTQKDAAQVLALFSSAADSDTVDSIAARMESVLGGDLSDPELAEYAGQFREWLAHSSFSTERPIYGYCEAFVLFVARLIKSRHRRDAGWRLVLPGECNDFKPIDSNSNRQPDMCFQLDAIDSNVSTRNIQRYIDTFAIAEAKRLDTRAEGDKALAQLVDNSTNIYLAQLDRRFLWGLTVCASSVYAALMIHDKVLVSPAMDIRTAEGRKQFISLLVYWSMCPQERLGYDPTIRRCESGELQSMTGDSVQDEMDSIAYEIDCYDDKECQWHTYISVRTIAGASRCMGRHTRTIIARRKHEAGASAISTPAGASVDAQEVVIKDAWARTSADADKDDTRNEIELLRIVRNTFSWDKSMMYSKLEAGGTVQLKRDGVYVDDTTAAVLDMLGSDAREQLDIPYRVHRRIVTSPVGHDIKTVKNEEELIIVLAEAMHCHNRILNECGILHRDISTGNILVVRSDSAPSGVHGLLIDLDSAIQTDANLKAPAERSGTPVFMSIANVEDLAEDRTALDDWESLLYVICWLATFGIKSSNRIAVIENSEYPITSWSVGTATAIALAKRTHMDSSKAFETNITDKFQSKYKLLKNLALDIYWELFQHKFCPGAIFDPNPSPEISTRRRHRASRPREDPLVKRSQHVEEIVNNLMDALEDIRKEAEQSIRNKDIAASLKQ
ncbi:hypothetical protein BX667DRAFT_515796 [Coemansia mojavensis]|nr:hypothetical protein BX667DRAFT_515796 [Coemansia mojavensis]